LKQHWLTIRERGYQGFHELIGRFAEAGVLPSPAGPADVDEIADLTWLISEFWLPCLEVSGREINAGYLERGVQLMLRVIRGSEGDNHQLQQTG
jgi:hypothetical protein